jgi:hypothetical protein
MTKIVRATLGLPTLWAGPRFHMRKIKLHPYFISKCILFSSLAHLNFEFVSGFDISISNFRPR